MAVVVFESTIFMKWYYLKGDVVIGQEYLKNATVLQEKSK
jgi:hypothetical protein